MANTVVLTKDYQKRNFSPKAAKIAIEHFGWSEQIIPAKPSEVGTKTKPPIIDKPVILKTIPIEKKVEVKVEVNDDLAVGERKQIITDDSGVRLADKVQNDPAKETEVKSDPVVKEKTKRKSPVKSKSKAK